LAFGGESYEEDARRPCQIEGGKGLGKIRRSGKRSTREVWGSLRVGSKPLFADEKGPTIAHAKKTSRRGIGPEAGVLAIPDVITHEASKRVHFVALLRRVGVYQKDEEKGGRHPAALEGIEKGFPTLVCKV